MTDSPVRAFLRGLRRNPVGLVGAFLTTVVVVAAVGAPWFAPYDPLQQNILSRFQGPSAAHPLGTDNFGRDTLSRVLFGARASLVVAFSSVGIATAAGATLGLVAAMRGGWTDRIVMRLMDVFLAFPIILLAIGILAILGPGPVNTSLAIAIVYTPVFARLARGPALSVLTWDFVTAAKALGISSPALLVRHVAPAVFAPVLVNTTLSLSTAILVEASLSFLGLGTRPPAPSLGSMLAESRDYMLLSPWVSVFAGVAILLASLGFNLFGDGLRDTLDPALRGRSG